MSREDKSAKKGVRSVRLIPADGAVTSAECQAEVPPIIALSVDLTFLT